MGKKIKAYFYRTPAGNEPVREWLKSLAVDDRQMIGNDIKTVEYGWPIGMPVAKPLGDGLYEVRSDISDKKIARVIFTIVEDKMILLNAFIKKSQKTPKEEVELAKKRKKEMG
ncbi:type II toxin-antitoxin system RelE/ParE family toxin [Desulfatirhabdium butyrativorans]|uniref:type II toxin-antitoxin system RelE/ParE family toxin n=1 Tax=Desulfatirhabdium butyrativorans TaxID=340467 RepID=UPI001B7FCAB5|nr:type II toxin-antitoxin system RelE/ParE family toxin [Desulfatirhabdium butyrativorans]